METNKHNNKYHFSFLFSFFFFKIFKFRFELCILHFLKEKKNYLCFISSNNCNAIPYCTMYTVQLSKEQINKIELKENILYNKLSAYDFVERLKIKYSIWFICQFCQLGSTI